MKVADTTPGKSYSVHSSAGCTVSDDSGWSKTLEAPEDYFTAHTSKVYIDDDAATVRELFKLAPQQRLTLLGVLGGDKLPVGYTRLEYLESTGTQYILTDFYLNSECDIVFAMTPRGSYVQPKSAFGSGSTYNEIKTTFSYWYNFGAIFDFADKRYNPPILPVDQKAVVRANKTGIFYNGKHVLTIEESRHFVCEKPLVLFSYIADAAIMGELQIFSFVITEDRITKSHFVPALDPTGAPCMYDTVTRTAFYNSGSGAFIAGVENQGQLNNMLIKLPDRTGQDVGTLQVRLADELQTAENFAKMDAILAKNWEITQAA